MSAMQVRHEIAKVVLSARRRLDEVERVCERDAVNALPARLLRMDATLLVRLMDALEVEQEREEEAMLRSLHRSGDHSLDPEPEEGARA